MLLNLLEYHWVENIDDALMLLSRKDIKTVPLAGGTYLLGQNDESIQAVIDLRDLELAYITENAQGTHIGAMTTLQGMVDSPVLKSLAAGLLSKAAQASSFSRLIRNSATLGGTLGAGVASQADLHTTLAVMDAQVVLRSGAQTQLNLSGGTPDRPGFALAGVTFKGKHERRIPYASLASELQPNELIIEVIIPPVSYSSGSAFQRIGRTPSDIAMLNAAALVEVADGTFQRVRVSVGGVNMEPLRLRAVEQQLEGQPFRAAATTPGNPPVDKVQLQQAIQSGMAEFRPPSDYRASTAYRRVSGVNLAYRVLEEAIGISHWRSIVASEGRA